MEQRQEHWTVMEYDFWLWTCRVFFSSVTLDISLNLSESFSCLIYKVRKTSVFPDHSVVFLSRLQGLNVTESTTAATSLPES